MEWFPWVLAVVLAVACLLLLLRGRSGTGEGTVALEKLAREVAAGRGVAAPASDDPPAIRTIREELRRSRPPVGGSDTSGTGQDSEGEVLRGLFRYVNEAVLSPLRSVARGGGVPEGVTDAVNALEDLAFYARHGREENTRTENVATLVQAVTREYALESGVPVRFSGPSEVLMVRVAPEGFKDALYLVLANAGHFGGGKAVEVGAQSEGDQVKVTVRDRGPGFSLEALDRAFRPFWTSEDDALGLGLTHARRVLASQGGEVAVRNREGGGAEVEIVLPRGR
jgi:signal transduction histidine kinase